MSMRITTPNGTYRLNDLIEVEKECLKKAIAEAAYYKAEKRGFDPGFETQDWMEAEMEILCADRNSQAV